MLPYCNLSIAVMQDDQGSTRMLPSNDSIVDEQIECVFIKEENEESEHEASIKLEVLPWDEPESKEDVQVKFMSCNFGMTSFYLA